MTVWVDNFRAAKRIGRINGRWSHLTASTPDELHAMADRLGLNRAWFQGRCKTAKTCPVIDGVCPHFHYDVVDAKRVQAIAAGAMSIDLREMGALTSARRRQFRSVLGTRPDVLTDGIEQGWADPILDPTVIDWPARQAVALVPFDVVDNRPVNPVEPDLPYGRNALGHWGERRCADLAVFVHVGGRRYLLMGDRLDGNGCGLPGGRVNPGEDPVDGAFRECREETGLHLDRVAVASRTTVLEPRYVPDPRAGREAWMVTVPVVVDLGQLDRLPPVAGSDDMRAAWWFPAGDFLEVCTEIGKNDLTVFPSHEGMLREIVDQQFGTQLDGDA